MSSPTKADLTAAVAKLTEENKGLRELLGAVVALAGVPRPAAYENRYYWACADRLGTIAVWAELNDYANGENAALHIRGWAEKLRKDAAKPVRYEVRADEPENCGHPLTGEDGQSYTCGRPPHSPEYAHEAWTADGTRVLDPAAVLAESIASGAPVAAGDEGAPAGPCPACHYGPDGTRLPCTLTHQYGAYGVADVSHMDADGTVFVVLRCRCGHPQDEHDDADDSDAGPALHECLHPACACATFRLAAVSVTA